MVRGQSRAVRQNANTLRGAQIASHLTEIGSLTSDATRARLRFVPALTITDANTRTGMQHPTLKHIGNEEFCPGDWFDSQAK